MNNINSVNFNTSSNMQSNLGFNSGFKVSALAADSRSSFGGFDIQKLASTLIEALKTGNLPEGLLEMLAKVLSPVEAGQLLAAIAKLLNGETNGGNAPQSSAPASGGNGEAQAGETTGSNASSATPANTSTNARSAPTTTTATPSGY